MFIQKLGTYHISSSHRRIYPRWTIKDLTWMTAERSSQIQHILRAMIDDMLLLAKDWKARNEKQPQFKKFGLESRAVLPLSSASSLGHVSGSSRISQSTIMAPRASGLTTTQISLRNSRASLGLNSQAAAASIVPVTPLASALSCSNLPVIVDLNKNNLPYRQPLHSKMETHVDLGPMFLILECSSSSAGSLRIREVEEDEASRGTKEIRRFMVHEIPTSTWSVCSTLPKPSNVNFWLQMQNRKTVEIEVVWQD